MLNIIAFYFLKKHRAWLILISSALVLEILSLYTQYIMLLKPCVLCIYQRCALFGIIFTGLLMLITPSYTILRIFGLLTWIYSSWQGLFFAKKQNAIHSYSSPFTTCEFLVQFPSWLPLDQWIPSVFYAYGDCTDNQWYFLKLDISQWMIIIFSIYLIIPIILLIYILLTKNNIINYKK